MNVGLEVQSGSSRAARTALVIRKAVLPDVASMYRLINHYAERELMLPKSQLQLYENLRDYSVVVDPACKAIVGCGALHIYWADLAELRAIAVAPERAHDGIGSFLVRQLVQEARDLGLQGFFSSPTSRRFFPSFNSKKWLTAPSRSRSTMSAFIARNSTRVMKSPWS